MFRGCCVPTEFHLVLKVPVVLKIVKRNTPAYMFAILRVGYASVHETGTERESVMESFIR